MKSENATIFWYQKLFSDIRKSKFPLVFAKINRYFIMFLVPESKLGHDSGHKQSRECNEMHSSRIFMQTMPTMTDVLISENKLEFLITKIIFWYYKFKLTFWYQKFVRFSDIRKWFSDIRN